MFPQSPNPSRQGSGLQVVETLCEQRYEQAAQELLDYLAQARKHAQLQFKALSVLPEPQLPAYLVRQA